MWTDPEEARSDFILAGATALFGPLIYSVLARLLQVQAWDRTLYLLVQAVAIFTFSGLVPVLLARHRDQGAEAFGLAGDRQGLAAGAVIGLPLVALWILTSVLYQGFRLRTLFGVPGELMGNPFDFALAVVVLVSIFLGNLLLYAFLAAKARDAFAQNEIGRLEALRTYGMSAAGGALAVGLLVAAVTAADVGQVLLDAVAVAAMVLLADRFVEPAGETTRAAVLAPAIVALVVNLELFGGAFLATLRFGLLAAGFTVVAATLVRSKRLAWGTVSLFAIATVYLTAASPFVQLGF